jgi:hypothetical protein
MIMLTVLNNNEGCGLLAVKPCDSENPDVSEEHIATFRVAEAQSRNQQAASGALQISIGLSTILPEVPNSCNCFQTLPVM